MFGREAAKKGLLTGEWENLTHPPRIVEPQAGPASAWLAQSQPCGYSSMVEPQPSKLKTRVRFPLPAPALRLSSPETWVTDCT